MKSALIVFQTIAIATAIAQDKAQVVLPDACSELNQAVMTQAQNGHLAEAEALLPRAPITIDERGQDACTGLVLGNLARSMAVWGRMAEAERLAEQSVTILENLYPQNDARLLRPLQILAALQLESGNSARAREALRKIRSIRIESPEDSAIVHATVGALLQMDGRRSEAEVEYQSALRAFREAGRSESADAATILNYLGALYVKDERLDEARRALDRALVIQDRAKDCLPIDRIGSLYLRSVLHARLGEWPQSEQDLRDALSMADRQPYVEPYFVRLILGSYSYALRRNHHRREARFIEARMTALPIDRTPASVVDVTELLLERKAAKKESIR